MSLLNVMAAPLLSLVTATLNITVVPASQNTTSVTTYRAYDFFQNNGADSEFSYTNVPEQYATSAIAATVPFLDLSTLRDGPENNGTFSGYNNNSSLDAYKTFCNEGRHFSSGENPLSGDPWGTFTDLASAPAANAASISVTTNTLAEPPPSNSKTDAGTTAIKTGQSLVIDPYGLHPETRTVSSIGGSGPYVLILSSALSYSHLSGQLVVLNDSTQPSLLQASSITSNWDNDLNDQGCYPLWIEPGNEIDNEKTYRWDDADPEDTIGHAPMWATLLVRQMAVDDAAKSSNSKYNGILRYGPGLCDCSQENTFGGTDNFPSLSLAQHDMHILRPDIIKSTLFPVDRAVQHTGPVVPHDAPDGPNGVIPATVNLIYATPAPVNGEAVPSGYTANFPQIWDEYGEAYQSPYFCGCGNGGGGNANIISQPLGVHYEPRLLLALFAQGLRYKNDADFLTDNPGDGAFQTLGFVDVRGNPTPTGYAMANFEHMIGYGNTGTLSSPTQLPFSVSAGSNIVAYSFENDDGSYWIILNDKSEESSAFASGNDGVNANFVGFSTVSIAGLPGSIQSATVYQNDESCNLTHWQPSTPFGTAYMSYPAGVTNQAQGDCEQYWPAGSLQNHIQASNPAVSGGTIAGLKVNGMPLLVRVSSASTQTVVPTMTPLPYLNSATPGPSGTPPTPGPTLSPTPVPSFGPPT